MKLKQKALKLAQGFSLIELVVSLAIFTLLILGVIAGFSALSRATKVAREKTVVSTLASQYMENVRNMPYSQIGTMVGSPTGPLPDFVNAYSQTIEGVVYKIYYETIYIDDPADGTASGSPADSDPADYKQVKLTILNTLTNQTTEFITNVVPDGLEGTTNSGTIAVKVIDATGLPVEGADIHIQYPTTSPHSLDVVRTSDSNGDWVEVGLTPAVNNYRIVVTKAGYSTDQTYPITASNPNPTKPDATVQTNTVTSLTFAIDLLSNLTIRTVDQFCANINGVGVNVVGAKLIGTSPDVPKYAFLYYSGPPTYPNGQIDLTSIEWDTYTPTLAPSQPYTVVGTSPIQKIDVLPNTSQVFTMYLDSASNTGVSLLVIVKDINTGAPLEGAVIHLHKGGSLPQDYFGTSGGSVWQQSDWGGGPGYPDWNPSQPDTYYQQTGNIFINTGSGSNNVELQKFGGNYITGATSTLESSSFDTGSPSTSFTTLLWQPPSQSLGTFLGFQIATNNDNSTWDFVGPDGTADTYYTVPGNTLNSVHTNQRYVRYKAFLSTEDKKKTPVLSSLVLNFVSGCFAPGQFFFSNLTPSSGAAWDITVTLPGYLPYFLGSVDISTGFNPPLEILMTPL